MSLRVAVLYGGLSEEREVSLRTGEAVANALSQKGYEVTKIDVDRNVITTLSKDKFDVAYIALHGKYGEDGTIQGLLELVGIPYTGPDVMTSAICINKIMTKRVLLQAGLPTPKFNSYSKTEINNLGVNNIVASLQKTYELPVVVKAPTQGSTIGIYFIHKWDEMAEAINNCLKYGSEVLVEEFVNGIELTASVLGNDDPQALSLIEIVSATGVYDYHAKYTKGMSDHIIPPRIDAGLQQEIKKLAVEAYKVLNCRGLSRVDFMVVDQKPYILEVNTSPGMTETSLFPDAAKDCGIEFTELVDKLIKFALE